MAEPSPQPDRRTLGQRGEQAAQNLLERHGYQIVDINVRFGKTRGHIGEVDIIAWDQATLCFVEVKTRRARREIERFTAAENVTPAKQRQIAQLALAYAARHELLSEGTDRGEAIAFRFDVVAVTLSASGTEVIRQELIRGAFLAPNEDGDDRAFSPEGRYAP